MQVIYLEACESGSIFEGILPEDINVYATTASGAEENSYGTYCPGMEPSPPPEYITCLGDLYSIAWMEDRYIDFILHFLFSQISILMGVLDLYIQLFPFWCIFFL